VLERIGLQEMLTFKRMSRVERGDSANDPNVQRHTSAQIQMQAGMRKQA